MSIEELIVRVRNRLLFIFNLLIGWMSGLLCNLSFWLYQNKYLQPSVKQFLSFWRLEIRANINIASLIGDSSESQRFHFERMSELQYRNPVYSGLAHNSDTLISLKRRQIGTIINSSYLIGGSNLILTRSDDVLYDSPDHYLNFNYLPIDRALIYSNRELSMIHVKNSSKTIDQGIRLSGNLSWNYFHFIYELIARFKALEESDIDIEIPFLIDNYYEQVPQFKELLIIFNTKKRKLISLEPGVKYFVKNLYYFSPPNLIPPHFKRLSWIKNEDCLYDFTVLNYLRSQLIKEKSDREFPHKIFISRDKASGRRRYNEEEVFQLLKKFGFERINPEYYSISDQVALFHQADFIAGGSGAALANILVCRHSCKVLCFTNYQLPLTIFSTLAAFSQCELTYMSDQTRKLRRGSRLHDPFRINLNELDQFLQGWVNQ